MPDAAPAICRRGRGALPRPRSHRRLRRLVDAAVTERPGVQEVSTLQEPYRVAGKKTMGLEIVEQLGWRMPDVIVYPTGCGVGIIGIHKALRELLELGWVDGQLPRLVALQAAGWAAIMAT